MTYSHNLYWCNLHKMWSKPILCLLYCTIATILGGWKTTHALSNTLNARCHIFLLLIQCNRSVEVIVQGYFAFHRERVSYALWDSQTQILQKYSMPWEFIRFVWTASDKHILLVSVLLQTHVLYSDFSKLVITYFKENKKLKKKAACISIPPPHTHTQL